MYLLHTLFCCANYSTTAYQQREHESTITCNKQGSVRVYTMSGKNWEPNMWMGSSTIIQNNTTCTSFYLDFIQAQVTMRLKHSIPLTTTVKSWGLFWGGNITSLTSRCTFVVKILQKAFHRDYLKFVALRFGELRSRFVIFLGKVCKPWTDN